MSITALNNTVTVFQPICKGHFLGSLTQSCHSSFFFFLHSAIGSLFFTVWYTDDFSFQAVSSTISRSSLSLPLYKSCQSFRDCVYIVQTVSGFHSCSTKFLWRPISPPSSALSDSSSLSLTVVTQQFCYTLSYKSVSRSLLAHLLPVIQTLRNKHFQVKTASLFLCSASYDVGGF